jgi:CheY-like chemotaxis protein/HPt (histidine-containing phosphotransfer) domain-containing protein
MFVLCVPDGEAAVEALKKEQFDLVLMDCYMPDVDGFEATVLIRSAESQVRNHDIPIIAMTAGAMKGDRDKCFESGMNDFLTKPIIVEQLTSVLQKWLPLNTQVTESIIQKKQEPEKEEQTVLFDYDNMLSRVMGDKNIVRKILDVYVDDIPKRIQDLKDAVRMREDKKTLTAAHTIKGASANVSVNNVRNYAALIEEKAKSADYQSIEEMLPVLDTAFAEAVSEIHIKIRSASEA